MPVRIGDVVFKGQGTPAIAVGRDAAKGQLILDTDKELNQSATRHGILNGMTPETRLVFNELMDRVKSEQNPEARVVMLKEKAEELAKDPRQLSLYRYVLSELNHFMHAQGQKQRYYNIPEYKAGP